MTAQTRSRTRALLTPAKAAWANLGDEDDDSELTDLEDEDELEEEPPPPPPRPLPKPRAVPPPRVSSPRKTRPTTQRNTHASRKVQAAKQHSYLNTPANANLSLDLIFSLLEKNKIDLCPDYQRDVVWSEEKQINLIDSFRHNYPIPPIICAMKTDEYGNAIRTCIDGKQRLTSILLFMRGEIPYKDSITGKKTYFTKPSNAKRGKVMSEERRSEFQMKTLAFLDYQNLTFEQEMEIFNRVQMGVSLTPAERLQSVNSPSADIIRQFRNELGATNVFKGWSEWGGNRGKDFMTLVQIAYLLRHSGDHITHEPTIARITTWIGKEEPQKDVNDFHHSLVTAFNIFCRIAHHPVYGDVLVKGDLSPLEFVFSIYLIHLFKKRMTDCQTSDAIAVLRKHIRSADRECKWTTPSFKRAMDYIKRIVASTPEFKTDDNKTLAVDAPPLDPAALKVEDDEEEHVPPPLPVKGRKRSCPDPPAANDMDVDEEPAQTTKKRKVIPSETKPAPKAPVSEDESSESDAPLSSMVVRTKASEKRRLLPRKDGESAAQTKVRRSVKTKPKGIPASAVPPSKDAGSANQSTALVQATHIQDSDIGAAMPRQQYSRPPPSSVTPSGRLDKVHELNRSMHPLPEDRACHKLPTPPTQDEPQYQQHQEPAPRSKVTQSNISASPHVGSIAAQQQQHPAAHPPRSIQPAVSTSSKMTAVSGNTMEQKKIPKGLNFNKKSSATIAPPPSAAQLGPPPRLPARQQVSSSQSNPLQGRPQFENSPQAFNLSRTSTQRAGGPSPGVSLHRATVPIAAQQVQAIQCTPRTVSAAQPPTNKPGSPQQLGQSTPPLVRRQPTQEQPTRDPRRPVSWQPAPQ